MRGWRYIVSCLAVIGAFALSVPAGAFADSAGDQQYVDPLAGNTTSTASAPPAAAAPAPSASAPRSSPSAAAAPAPAATAASSSATPASSSAAVAATTSTAAASTSATLPYTGLDVWLCAAVGVGLLGSGLVVRRLARSG